MQKLLLKDQSRKMWVLLNEVRDAMDIARKKEIKRYKISALQFGVLYLAEVLREKATPANIGRNILRSSSSIAQLLGRMERDGLVRRVNDLDRKNLVRVELTEKGHKIYEKANKGNCIRNIFSSLSPEEQQQMISFLKTLRGKARKELVNYNILKIPKAV